MSTCEGDKEGEGIGEVALSPLDVILNTYCVPKVSTLDTVHECKGNTSFGSGSVG